MARPTVVSRTRTLSAAAPYSLRACRLLAGCRSAGAWICVALALISPRVACSPSPLADSGVIAHRGYSLVYPENTLLAIRKALDAGAQAVEIDVRMTSDGVLVLMHDSAVDRTTDGTGVIEEMSFAAVRKLDAGAWKGPQFKGQRVPTFRQVLAMFPGDAWLNVHLNGPKLVDIAVQATQAIVDFGKENHVYISTSTAASVEAARLVAAQNNKTILINNMIGQGTSQAYIDATIAGGFFALQFLDVTQPLFIPSPENMDRLSSHSITINYNAGTLLNVPSNLLYLVSENIRFPMVDDVETALSTLESIGKPRIERFPRLYYSMKSSRPECSWYTLKGYEYWIVESTSITNSSLSLYPLRILGTGKDQTVQLPMSPGQSRFFRLIMKRL